jgi:predicted dehydrogenase
LVKIAIVGCGYVFDHYMETLPEHPILELAGVFDKNAARLTRVQEYFKVPVYGSLQEVFDDPTVELVVNLTDPDNHFPVSRAALAAGKHVYSEKPLAAELHLAKNLVALAEANGLLISGAPCSLLGEAAQTVWKTIRDGAVGTPKLVYAELDDNPVYLMKPEGWSNESGAPWPYLGEYQVGCTLEHAGYYLTWLCAYFGPAETVTAFSSRVIEAKTPIPLERPDTPDFSVAVIKFSSGVVARLTCSIVAPYDHRLRVIGDEGMVAVDECWQYNAPVKVERFSQLSLNARKSRTVRTTALTWPFFGVHGRKVKLVGGYRSNVGQRIDEIRSGKRSVPNAALKAVKKRELVSMDFFRGPAEMASAIREDRRSALPADFVLHVNEITLAMQQAGEQSTTYRLTTTFEPLAPGPAALVAFSSRRTNRSGALRTAVEKVVARLHRQ